MPRLTLYNCDFARCICPVNPNLNRLQPYPFEKLKKLFESVTPNKTLIPISLSIGEPKHPTPIFIREALISGLDGLSNYPGTQGIVALRQAIADWLMRRYGLKSINPDTQVLPVNGSREALFAFAQTVVDASSDAIVIIPNPFYQIYEGATFLAGATPYFLNRRAENNFEFDLTEIPADIWKRTQLIYVCSPDNPTGKVVALEQWQQLFELSDKYGFVIAADECYSELYFDEDKPTLGALEAAKISGRDDFHRLVTFNSLSKRSNVPGMRSGFVAGDAEIVKKFLLYRTYHGSAMSPAVSTASLAAWQDESHVHTNRMQYLEKFTQALPLLQKTTGVTMPDASFYFWLPTPIPDTEFAQRLYHDYNVSVLPGSYMGREAHGVHPGENFVRIALVAPMTECLEGIKRIAQFCHSI